MPAKRARSGWLLGRETEQGTGTRRYRAAPVIWLVIGVFVIVSSLIVCSDITRLYLGLAVYRQQPELLSECLSENLIQFRVDLENLLFARAPPTKSRLQTIRLSIPKHGLILMFESIKPYREADHSAGGTKPYVKALVQVDGKRVKRCKVCLRGYSPWHHERQKNSFRVRLKKREVNGGPRYLEVSRPEDTLAVKNWLPMKLGEELGLISDGIEPVRLFVDNKYFGVYLKTMRQGEAMTIHNRRMPGTYFKGDFKDLWKSVDEWSIHGKQDLEDIAVFERFLRIVKKPASRDTLKALDGVLDFDKYARWSALMIVTGSVHTDDYHNHSYFFSPYQGKLEPIPWDPNSFNIMTEPDTPVDTVRHPVVDLIIRDPHWVHLRNMYVKQLLDGNGSAERMIAAIDSQLEMTRPDLMADRNLGDIGWTGVGWRMIPKSVLELDRERDRTAQYIRQRDRYLRDYLARAKAIVAPHPDDTSRSVIQVVGNVALELTRGGAGSNRLLYPALSRETRNVIARLYRRDSVDYPVVDPVPAIYELNIPIDSIELRNAITGRVVQPERAGSLERLSIISNKLPSIESRIPTRTIALSAPEQLPAEVVLGPGVVHLKKDVVIGRNQQLIIKPGSVLVLEKKVGIYSLGKILALGTEKEPIKIGPASGSSWGAIAVLDQGAKDSRFNHVFMQGGSRGNFQNRRFNGMLSVYGCPQVVLENCSFGRNRASEFSVDIARSSARVSNCRFQQAPQDALGLHLSRAIVRGSTWKDVGGAAIELSGSGGDIDHCTIETAVEGLIVDEKSNLNATNVYMSDCDTAAEIRDQSFARFLRCRFENNQTGVSGRQVNRHFKGGGGAWLDRCAFKENRVDLSLKRRSRFRLTGTTATRCDGAARRYMADDDSIVKFIHGGDAQPQAGRER